ATALCGELDRILDANAAERGPRGELAERMPRGEADRAREILGDAKTKGDHHRLRHARRCQRAPAAREDRVAVHARGPGGAIEERAHAHMLREGERAWEKVDPLPGEEERGGTHGARA